MWSNSGPYSELELGDAAEHVRPAGVTAVAILLLVCEFIGAGALWLVWITLSGDMLLTGDARQHISAAMVTLLIASLPMAVFAIGLFGLREWARLGTVVYLILNIVVTFGSIVAEGTGLLGGGMLSALLALVCVRYLCSDPVACEFRQENRAAKCGAVGAAVLAHVVQLIALIALGTALQAG
jgi:hypothetical protein